MVAGGQVASQKPAKAKEVLLTALVANGAGEIFELDGYAAVGMAGSVISALNRGPNPQPAPRQRIDVSAGSKTRTT